MSDKLSPGGRRRRRTSRGILAVLAGGALGALFSASPAFAAVACTDTGDNASLDISTTAGEDITIQLDAAGANEADFMVNGVPCTDGGTAQAVTAILLTTSGLDGTGDDTDVTFEFLRTPGGVDYNYVGVDIDWLSSVGGGAGAANYVILNGQNAADSFILGPGSVGSGLCDINGATAGSCNFSVAEGWVVNGRDGGDFVDATVPLGANIPSTFNGGPGNDSITGVNDAAVPDTINGDAGDDSLFGLGGADIINGNLGSDLIDGGRENDTLNGGPEVAGSDVDTISYQSAGTGFDVDLVRGTACDPTGALAIANNCTTANTELDTFFNFENARGGSASDILSGDAGRNVLTGLAGDDTLNGRAGDDTLDGSGGTDTATYFDATAGITLTLTTNSSQITGGSGTDIIVFDAGLSTIENLDGSAFVDSLTGDSQNNLIRGLGGNDAINGGAGADSLYGDDGGTTSLLVSPTGLLWATSGFGNDTINGGTGPDLIEPGYGDDFSNGGGGPGEIDTLSYDGFQKGLFDAAGFPIAPGVTINILTSSVYDTVVAGMDQNIDFDNVIGSDHDDTITGNDSSNTLTGGLGSDWIEGLLADDVLAPGGPAALAAGVPGDTCIYTNAIFAVTANIAAGTATGGANNDTGLGGCENLWGSAFNDTLTGDGRDNLLRGNGGNDVLTGGGNGGFGDYADYRNATAGVVGNLTLGTVTGGAGSDSLSAIENLIGSDFADFLTGDANANDLLGQGGDDDLRGLAGADVLGLVVGYTNRPAPPATDPFDNTETGNDVMEGGLDADLMTGGAPGECSPAAVGCGDEVTYENATTGCTIDISDITGVMLATSTCAGVDSLGDLFENVTGSPFGDTIAGNMLNNYMIGLAGNDVMTGGVTGLATSGNDIMEGNDGDDSVSGFDGRDTIYGGNGNDELNGDAGGTACGTSSGVCDDILYGGPGSDDQFGQEGNDWMQFVLAEDGSVGNLDTYDGGAANDTLCANTSCGAPSTDTAGIFADLISETLNTYQGALRNMENVHAGDGDDDLLGNSSNNVLTAGDLGDDTLFGRAGDDALHGGGGSDEIFGGRDDDSLLGGDGDDRILSGDDGNDFVSAGAGNDRVAGGRGDDVLRGGDGAEDQVDFGFEGDSTGVHANLTLGLATGDVSGSDSLNGLEDIRGTLGPDVLRGDANSNWIRGLRGDDRIDGLAGADILDGNAGDDNVRGGADDDTMYGAAGSDLMNGGSGSDFIVGGTGRDTIRARDGEADTIQGRRGWDTAYVDAIDDVNGVEEVHA